MDKLLSKVGNAVGSGPMSLSIVVFMIIMMSLCCWRGVCWPFNIQINCTLAAGIENDD